MIFEIGSDPEFLLVDSNNNLKSAISVIKRGKNKKIKIKDCLFFYDNVLAECTIVPSKNLEDFNKNIKNSLKVLSEIVKPYKLSNLSSGTLDDSEMNHKDSRISGCSPEYCAYSLSSINPNKVKNFFKKSNFRTAGGHIHLGTDLGKDDIKSVMLVRMLDLFLGTTCLILEDSDHHFERRKIYGQLGRYRQPKHGIEYRTPSNFWLMSPNLVELVCEICDFCISFVKENKYELFWRVDLEKLNSDSFWNSGGNPSDCHVCFGYDVNLLQKLYKIKSKEKDMCSIKKIADYHLPNNIKLSIKKLQNKKFDLYKEWDL